MRVCTLASSSKGNCLVVSWEGTHILLDAGISARRITAGLKELGLAPGDLTAVIVTHCHTDHIAGLTTLVKQHHIPVYATCASERPLRDKVPALDQGFHSVMAGEEFQLGGITVRPFATPHDIDGSVGYRLTCPQGSMALATDFGHVTSAVLEGVLGAELLLIEANHDEDWVRTSIYPVSIQSRILGDYGHISNETGAEVAVQSIRLGTQAVVLAHLSPENNTPAHALAMVGRRLAGEGMDHIHLSVAPQQGNGPVFTIKNGQVAVEERSLAVC